MLPISTTSTPVAIVVSDDEDDQLDQGSPGVLVQHAHRTLTSDPARVGANSMAARSDIWSTGMPSEGAISELISAFCEAVPDVPVVNPGVGGWR